MKAANEEDVRMLEDREEGGSESEREYLKCGQRENSWSEGGGRLL